MAARLGRRLLGGGAASSSLVRRRVSVPAVQHHRCASSFEPPPSLTTAVSKQQTLRVDAGRGTGFLEPDVYSTPNMISDMEVSAFSRESTAMR